MVKKSKPVKEQPKKEQPRQGLDKKELIVKREDMINNLRGLLLTNEQLKRGGRSIRVQYEREKSFQAEIDEINKIGSELGFPPVSMGALRK